MRDGLKVFTRTLTAFVLAAVFVLGSAMPAFAAPAAIFTSDFAGGPRRVDPIVSPGVESAHEHCFYGVEGVTSVETSQSLREKPSTWVEQDNHSAFWIPCVYEDGRLLQPATRFHALLYYQPVKGEEQVPPENTAGVTHETGYRCGTGGGTIRPLPPTTCDAGVLVVSGFFRGERDLGLSEPFPKVRFFVRLNIGSGPVGNITLGGPPGAPGAMGPETLHADYFWGWDRDAFERFLEECVRPGDACGKNPDV